MSKNASWQINKDRRLYYPTGEYGARFGNEPRSTVDVAQLQKVIHEFEDYLGFDRSEIGLIENPKDIPPLTEAGDVVEWGLDERNIRMRFDVTAVSTAVASGAFFATLTPNRNETSIITHVTRHDHVSIDYSFPLSRAYKQTSPSILDFHRKLEKCGMWVWPMRNGDRDTVLALRPPIVVLKDGEGRLHCDDGPSVSWPGEDWYFIHGTKITKKILDRDFTVQDAWGEHNVEVRRVMFDIYGLEELMNDLGAKVRQRDKYGALWRFRDNHRTIQAVEVVNSSPEPDGTFKHYWLRVPFDVKSAHEAVAWTFGKTKKEYRLEKET